jgi:hypothetical protein
MNFQEPISGLIERIARAIERLGPREADTPDFEGHDAFVWQAEMESLPPHRGRQSPAASAAERHRPDARHAPCQHDAFRPRPSR